MKNFKKSITLILTAMIIVTFTACNKEQTRGDFRVDNNSTALHNSGKISESKNNHTDSESMAPENDHTDSESIAPEEEFISKEGNETIQEEISGKNPVPEHNSISNDSVEQNQDIVRITREEAGLSTIPYLNFDSFEMNPRILSLLENSTLYTHDDYRNGLIYDDIFLIVSQRFDGCIIEDIAIGDEISKVSQILGEPSYITGGTVVFKTKNYYLGFLGVEKIEQAILSPVPKTYTKDILEKLVVNLNQREFGSIPELLIENSEISEFFDYDGHIHGGGWYAQSMNGIYIEQFVDNSITIYNNFEGDLYRTQEDINKYGIVYQNNDCIIDRMLSALNGYRRTNEAFEQEGVVSPNGKYSSLYRWNYSQSYYFIIRAMDYSHPDVYISLPATGDYYWLNDKYILYQDFFSQAPILLNVETVETINIFENVGVFEVDDYGFYSFKIKGYQDGEIVVFYEDEQKEYIINYSFDPMGEIKLNHE
ncbi:MAG: hypothetical protein GX283_00925 [Clostridiaceae bacterium]|jgi:hypothetical protein|nr:hypothetical protein [Clostridiaceae bacterium]